MKQTSWTAIIAAALISQVAVPAGARAETRTAQTAAPNAAEGQPGSANPTELTRVDQRIAQLHVALQITADEEAQWQAFADVMRNNARERNLSHQEREAQLATLSATESMESFVRVAREHAEELQRLATAFQVLYAAMPVEQKQVADRVLRKIAAKRALE